MPVRFAVEGLRQQADAKRQVLTVDVADDLPTVFGNPPRLRQMLTNLLDNALKYTPEGGAIRLDARRENDLVLLTISDAGIGVPAADQPYIFDKFYRATNSRHDYTGTGLGLSIVKSIVENHDGRIWLDSRPGTGSTFTVVLPQYNSDARR